MAVLIEVAEAVAASLDAADWGMPAIVERAWVPVHELEDLGSLRVTVVPTGFTLTASSRRDDDFDYAVDVGLQRRFADGTLSAAEVLAAVDPLAALVEMVADRFRGRRLDGHEAASCVGVEVETPFFRPDHLDAHRVFTAVVRLTFRASRAR